MPRRLIIHAGFHKTGTTTVQRALRVNRALLKPYLRSVLKPPLVDTLHASRGFSTWRDPITLQKFRRRFHDVLASITGMPRRCLVISAEELSGHLPGRDHLDDYSAAVELAREMAAVAAEVMPEAELVFYYSTRAADPWLRSAYWQHVRASSMTLDFEDYCARYAGSADLDGVIDAVASAQPARVERAALDAQRDAPAGPVSPLLDLCDVPAEVQARLDVSIANPALGDDVLAALLQANRDIDDLDRRKEVKAAILASTQPKGA